MFRTSAPYFYLPKFIAGLGVDAQEWKAGTAIIVQGDERSLGANMSRTIAA